MSIRVSDPVASSAVPRKSTRTKFNPDWWSKTLTGALSGFTLALGLSGLFAWLGPGGISAPGKAQFTMWIIPPLWMMTFSLVYLFRTGLHALFWLLTANAFVYGILITVQQGWI